MKNHVYSQVKELQTDKDEAIKNFYDQRSELLNPIFEKLHEFKNLAKLYLLN